jgi:small nuclear ribonucleoprotein (snRNP)-like protein
VTSTLIACATALILATGFFVLRPRSLVRSRLRSRVVVTLKSGASFEGVLAEVDARAWVLRSAQALGVGDHGANVPVDGEVLILVSDVEYAQRPAL